MQHNENDINHHRQVKEQALKQGKSVPPSRVTACRWCAQGAIAKACAEQPWGSRPNPHEVLDVVEKHLQRSLWQFNDEYTTKHQDVVDLLDKAALQTVTPEPAAST